MNGIGRTRVVESWCLTAIVTALMGCFVADRPLRTAEAPRETADAPEAPNLVFVSDDPNWPMDGCDEVTIVDVRTGRALAHGEHAVSPGRLAVTSDGRKVVSVSSNSGDLPGNPKPFVYAMWRSGPNSGQWQSDHSGLAQLIEGAPPAISPDDSMLLLPIRYGIEKFAMADMNRAAVGPSIGRYPDVMPGPVVFAADSRTAYVVDVNGSVHIVDVGTMKSRYNPIPFDPITGDSNRRVRNTNAALSADERYLVINAGTRAELTVIDLDNRQAHAVPAGGLRETWGVGFNYVGKHRGLLAVHGGSKVAIYEFNGPTPPVLLALATVPKQRFDAWEPFGGSDYARVSSMAWSGNGDAIITAIGKRQEWRVLEYTDDALPSLEWSLDFDSCLWPDGWSVELDVVTVNRLAPPPTVTATPCPTPSPTDTPANTPTPRATTSMPTASPSPPATPTASPTNTTTPTPTSSPTRIRQPAYLPLALREHCDPKQRHADVALVIDASTSMLDPTRDGRTKLAAAVDAVRLFLSEVDLPRDQAAIVEFNAGAGLLQPLTGRGSDLVEALRRIRVAPTTRIDLGIQVAREELGSARRGVGNMPVMIVLTDGRANPVGPAAAVREAAVARDAGVTVFTIGLGEDLDLDALRQIASKPEYFYRAPDGEDLRAIYKAIAVAIPCPREHYWGRR